MDCVIQISNFTQKTSNIDISNGNSNRFFIIPTLVWSLYLLLIAEQIFLDPNSFKMHRLKFCATVIKRMLKLCNLDTSIVRSFIDSTRRFHPKIVAYEPTNACPHVHCTLHDLRIQLFGFNLKMLSN